MEAPGPQQTEGSGKRRPSFSQSPPPDRPFKKALDVSFSHVVRRTSPQELGGDKDTAIWEGRISDEFSTGIAPFGGYVIALVLKVTQMEVGRLALDKRYPVPVSLSANLLEGGRTDAFVAAVAPLRLGGRFAVFDVAIRQRPLPNDPKSNWTILLTANVTCSDLGGENGVTTILADDGKTPITSPFGPSPLHTPSVDPTRIGLGVPRVNEAMPEEKGFQGPYRSPTTGRFFHEFFDVRHQPHTEEEIKALPFGVSWSKWVRWNRGDVQDIPSLGFWGDMGINPVMINWFRSKATRAWSPTMDFQLQIRAVPNPKSEWALIRSRSSMTTNGRRCVDIEMWSEEGVLLGVTRQMQGFVVVSDKRQARVQAANAAVRATKL